MSLKTSYPHISKDPGICGGKACIEGTRIRVLDVSIVYINPSIVSGQRSAKRFA